MDFFVFKGSTIQTLLNSFGHGVNRSLQLFLNHEHIFLISLCYQINRKPNLPKTSTSPDSMQVGGCIFGEIEIYDNIYTRHIDTSRY